MMQKTLDKYNFSGQHKIQITGSKSESNRLLILKAIYPNLGIDNLSNSDDTNVLQEALNTNTGIIDIHHAGTAMRFLTAYYGCFTKKPITLTGSQRMQERPIKILVDALRELGCDISYVNHEGYPPLYIKPSTVRKNTIQLNANISSQYITALMLVAPKLKNGLEIELTSKITSLPYLKMTQSLMKEAGLDVDFKENQINIKPQHKIENKTIHVESDWSSASYYFSLAALSKDLILDLYTYKPNSIQGDSHLVELYKSLGVKTTFKDDFIRIEKSLRKHSSKLYKADLNNTPDIAQTIAITCLGLNISCKLTGLETLKIKETDRLVALKTEIEKFGARVIIDEHSLQLEPTNILPSDIAIDTYNDHRMAMAFAPLSAVTSLKINDAEVVEKSYPDFWRDFNHLKNIKL